MSCATAQIEILAARMKKIGYDGLMEGRKMTNQWKGSVYEIQLLDCVKHHEILIK